MLLPKELSLLPKELACVALRPEEKARSRARRMKLSQMALELICCLELCVAIETSLVCNVSHLFKVDGIVDSAFICL